MPIPVGYAQSNLIFGGGSLAEGGECTIGWDISSYTGSAADLAEDIYTAAAADLLDNLVSTLTLTGVLVKFGPDATGPSALFSGTATGADSATGASSAVSYLVRKHTAFGGRAGRGRFYLPGVAENAITAGGLVDSTKRAAIETNVTAFVNAVVAALATPVLLHQAGSPITTPTPILSFTVDGLVATQRRRQRK